MSKANIFFPIFLLLLITASAKAQHCPFDGLAILVVQVVDSETGEQIQQAQIKVCDANGDVVLNWNNQPLHFVRNPEKTDQSWDYDHFEKIRYSFAENNFILPLMHSLENQALFIVVESCLGQFETTFFELSPENYFDLHDNIGTWTELRNSNESPKVEFDKLIRIEVKK